MNNNDNEIFSSPMYNLSLCSLENFHTSFLAWVIENYPKETLSSLLKRNFSQNIEIEIKTQVKHSKDIILDLDLKGFCYSSSQVYEIIKRLEKEIGK